MVPEWQKELQKKDLGFTPRPTVCPICGGQVIFGFMEEFGLKPYQNGFCYYCPTCGAYVATHRHRTKEALGVLGNSKDRKLRACCHQLFNEHWESSKGRENAYDITPFVYSSCCYTTIVL